MRMIEDTRGQEFIEEREQQFPPDTRPGGDVRASTGALGDFNRTPAGEPDLKYDVRSTFDSRPVNAYDFNTTGRFYFPGADETPLTEQFGVFVVPEGFVAIARKWYFTISPVPFMLTIDQ